MGAGVMAGTARAGEGALATVAGLTVGMHLVADTGTASTLAVEATVAMAPAVTPMVADTDMGSTLVAEAMAVTPTVVDMDMDMDMADADTAVAATTDVVTADTGTMAVVITGTATGAVRCSGLDSGTRFRHRLATTFTGIQSRAMCRLTAPTVTLPIEQGKPTPAR